MHFGVKPLNEVRLPHDDGTPAVSGQHLSLHLGAAVVVGAATVVVGAVVVMALVHVRNSCLPLLFLTIQLQPGHVHVPVPVQGQ